MNDGRAGSLIGRARSAGRSASASRARSAAPCPPITRIMTGPSSPTTPCRIESSSRSWCTAARSSMVSSSPLVSPLEIRWIIIGGKSRLWPSERPIGAAFAHPHRRVVDRVPHRQVGDDLAGDAQRLEHRHRARGERAQSVRAKRAVLPARTTLPISGSPSRNCVPAAPVGLDRAARGRRGTAPPPIAMRDQSPSARMKSLVAISTCVSSGSSALLLRNTSTIFGTTDTSRKNTIATHTTNSSTG